MLKNKNFYYSYADQKRIWVAGDEEEPDRFKKEDLAAWFRVWNQT
jgi:hypothetical protein